MGDIYLREYADNEVTATRIKGVGIKTSSGIKNAKQIYVRPGPAIIAEWENDPATFLAQHPDNNPNTDPNFFNWHPVWSMMVTFHYGDNTTTTRMVAQGSEIGPLPSAAALDETFTDGQVVQRTFNAWSRSSGNDYQVIDEHFVVNRNIDIYALYDYIVTFKDGSTLLDRKVVKRNELLGNDNPVVEDKNDVHGVWKTSGSNEIHYSPSSRINSDLTLYPATDIEITFDLNGSGEITNDEKFFVSTVYGQDTWGDLIDNAPIPNATGYGDTYQENSEYDFIHTGKIFLGWYTAAEGGTKITEKSRTAARTDKVFYAHWKDNLDFNLYGLQPNGMQKIGGAKILDERYGDIQKANLDLDHYVNGNPTIYYHTSISKEAFTSNDFSYIQLFSINADQPLPGPDDTWTIWYYKWPGMLDEQQIYVEMWARNIYHAENGRYYSYRVEKTRQAYWLTINLKEGTSSNAENFTDLNKSDFIWYDNTDFDKMFDFSTGQIKILSSYDSTSGISKHIPYWSTNTPIEVQTKWTTESDSSSYYGLGVQFSTLNRSKDGQCWKAWSKGVSDADSISIITNDTANTRLNALWCNMWVTNTLTLPNGDNSTWSWEVQNGAKKYPTSSNYTLCAALRGISPHHYTVEGVQRSDGETIVLSSNIPNTTLDTSSTIGAASYTFDDLINYSQIKLTAYSEDERFYNSFSKNIYLYTIKYKYYDSPSATTQTTVTDGSYLISNQIPIKTPMNSYYYYSDSYGNQTQVFDHWTYNSTNYHPGNYFVGNTGLDTDTTIQFNASYTKKYNITNSLLGFNANSFTNTLTWNEIYATNDSTEKAAWYKVIGIDNDNQEIVLSDISGYTNGFIPASVTSNGQISLTTNAFDHNIVSIRFEVFNSDKTLYNSYKISILWYELDFYPQTYGQNLSQNVIYRLAGEKIGTLPTVESTRENYAFSEWQNRWYSTYSGMHYVSITEDTILSDLTVYSDIVPTRQAVPLWAQTGYLITFDNGYPWYGTTDNLYKNKSSDNTYSSVAAQNVSVGSSTSLPSIPNITSSSEFAQLRSNSNSKLTWTFLGWATSYSNFAASQSNGEYIPSIASANILAAGSSYTPSADVTLYGVWKLNQYTVTFNTGGADQNNSSALTNIDNQVTVPTLTKSGYDFDGWFSAASGGTEYTISSGKFTTTSNTTLYAHWSQSTVTVTYTYIDEYGDTDSWEEEVEPTNSYYVSDEINGVYYLDSNDQTQRFKCWSRDGTEINPDNPLSITQNTTFTAVYQPYYNITASTLGLEINGYYDHMTWNRIYETRNSSIPAYYYHVDVYYNGSWVTIGSNTSGFEMYDFHSYRPTKIRVYATDRYEEIQNYYEKTDLVWYDVTVRASYDTSYTSVTPGLIGDEINLSAYLFGPNAPDEISKQSQTDTAPYYLTVYSGYKNVTKNTTLSVSSSGGDYVQHTLVASDFINYAATFEMQILTSIFLSAPNITSTNYDTKIITWSNVEADSYICYKNGTEDSRDVGEPINDTAGTVGQGQNLWWTTTTSTSCEFQNRYCFYRVRVAAQKEYNGNTYTVYSEWVEVSGHPVLPVYGVFWDCTTDTSLTRTDSAANFSDPVPYINNASVYSSPFDTISPWKDMVVSERTGGTMVAIPKFWYRLTPVTGGGFKLQISPEEVDGFSVSPAHMDRGDGEGERDVVYIGRYHCCVGSSSAGITAYKSVSGQKPKVSITKATARTSIKNLGTGIYQADIAMRYTIWMLYLVEFADWDSQNKIGYGCGTGASSIQYMGYTDSMPYHTGSTTDTRATYGLGTQYRNIEGLWDNVFDWCDGCYKNSSGTYIILNPESFNNSANGTLIQDPWTSGARDYPYTFSVIEQSDIFPSLMPLASASKNSTSKGTTDYSDFGGTSSNVMSYYVGGLNSGTYRLYGLFFIGAKQDATNSMTGCRIMELPPNS